MGDNSFLLTKWYLDCVADKGDTAILYVADLRWKAVSLRYGSALTVLDGKISSTSSLHGIAVPTSEGNVISVRQPALGVEGTWQRLRSAIRKKIFENAQGEVDWHCLQPMSEVDLRCQGVRIQGLGYAECLRLSIPPWHLPLRTLNWGRYLSPQDAVVWIDWNGTEQVQFIVHNGEEYQAGKITESLLVFADAGKSLNLDRGLILREGQLGDTVFSKISRLTKLLPRNVLALDECKWRSRGTFRTSAGESCGWAIHEVIKWKK